MVIVRRAYFFVDRMHWSRLTQVRQSVLENLILMTRLVRLSTAGVQVVRLSAEEFAYGAAPDPASATAVASVSAL